MTVDSAAVGGTGQVGWYAESRKHDERTDWRRDNTQSRGSFSRYLRVLPSSLVEACDSRALDARRDHS